MCRTHLGYSYREEADIFTESAHWADSVSNSRCPLVVCLCVPSRKPRFPLDYRLLVKERIANIGIPLDFLGFGVSMISCVSFLRTFSGLSQD